MPGPCPARGSTMLKGRRFSSFSMSVVGIVAAPSSYVGRFFDVLHLTRRRPSRQINEPPSGMLTRAQFVSLGSPFWARAYCEPLVSPAHAFYFRGMNVVLRSSAGLLG